MYQAPSRVSSRVVIGCIEVYIKKLSCYPNRISFNPLLNHMRIRAEKMGLDPEKLRQFLAEQYEQQTQAPAQPDSAGTESGDPAQPPEPKFHFNLKPEELEAYLDQYVIKQSEAKAILATKICTHFNRLNLDREEGDDLVGSIKNNVLMIGPTGVGKTYLIKLIARKLGVPFVKGDATKFSETGYVGGDVEDLVRELVREADGDIEQAQHGIIYIDEIDKIASTRGVAGPDVSRSGVQRNLLKLMEETEVDLKSPHDLASQMESVMQIQRTGKAEKQKINTQNILFIVSGAFSGLDEIIARRLNQGAMGFHLKEDETYSPTLLSQEELFEEVRTEDLIDYGFESEFVGRLPVVAVLTPLATEDLLGILSNPKSSVIRAKKRDFLAYGIELKFTDEAFAILAQRAFDERTGARGLVSALEKVLLKFEKSLPSTSIDQFTVTAEIVQDPECNLQALLVEHSLNDFIERFSKTHGVRLSFDGETKELVKQMAREADISPAEFCEQIFADYGHGLKLVELQDFAITTEILRKPQESLDILIKNFYSNRR